MLRTPVLGLWLNVGINSPGKRVDRELCLFLSLLILELPLPELLHSAIPCPLLGIRHQLHSAVL